jgi:antitoxin component of MazEF toxin-antitoxin module
VETVRKLQRVGGSVMLSVPPEALRDAGMKAGDSVVVRSAMGRLEVLREDGPDPDALEFMESFLAEYGKAMEKLATK